MKEEILKLLKENKGEFVSGQRICEGLDVTRTAVWKYINQLKEMGYQIESVTRKGYRLLSSPDLLTREEIIEKLETNYIGRQIEYYDSIDSTNAKAKELAASGAKEGTVIIADEQKSGRGRLGRNWTSPKSKGIWLSIILKPDIDPTHAAKVTQIGAAAVSKSINEIGIDNYIKWPNDIVVSGKKVCGILTEMNGELNRVNYIVIGIGINVNIEESDFPEDIKKTATSLKEEAGILVSRRDLTASILNNFEDLYNELVKENKITKSIVWCRQYSAILGKEIKIISRGQEARGKALDLTDEGELIVEDENGNVKKLISGEISVRGIDGYV